MRWITIKPVAAQRADKLFAKSRSTLPGDVNRNAATQASAGIPKKPVAMLRAQQMLADAPPEMRLPRALVGFDNRRFSTR